MNKKACLKGTKIVIENDLTVEEREIQTKLKDAAKIEREAGRNVRVGYQKLIIDGTTYHWDKTESKLQNKTKN